MRIDITITDSRNCDNQEVKHVVKLIFSDRYQSVLHRDFLVSGSVLLFDLVDL